MYKYIRLSRRKTALLQLRRIESLFLLGSQRTQELGLFFGSLETTMSKLGTGVDELEVGGHEVVARSVLHQRLSQNQRTLLNTNNGTLEHEPVFLDFTIANETTHGSDSLFGKIGVGLATGLVALLSDAVDLLVHFGTVEVSVLTGTWNGGRNTGRVPRSNTGDLTQTTMGLTRQTSDTPTSGHTFVTLTLGNTDHVNQFILVENSIDSDFLFKQALGKVDLCRSVTSVDLDLHNVSLLEAKVELAHLGVGNNTDNVAVLLNTFQLVVNVLATIFIFLHILCVGLLLALVPVLVASALELFTQVLGEDGGQGAETGRGLNVTNNTNNNHGRGFNNRNSIDNFTLVHESTGAINSGNNVSHTGLVPTERGEVRRVGGIFLGERADAAGMVLGTLLGKETQVTVTGMLELTMRPVIFD